MAVFSAIPWFKVVERYPFSGEDCNFKRRDLRRGVPLLPRPCLFPISSAIQSYAVIDTVECTQPKVFVHADIYRVSEAEAAIATLSYYKIIYIACETKVPLSLSSCDIC